MLLRAGADVNAVDQNGFDQLYTAAENQNVERAGHLKPRQM